MVNSKSEETSSKTFSVGGHTYTEQERDRDYYKRHVFSENPYLAMPSVEETKHIKDRYAKADKTQACYQVRMERMTFLFVMQLSFLYWTLFRWSGIWFIVWWNRTVLKKMEEELKNV